MGFHHSIITIGLGLGSGSCQDVPGRLIRIQRGGLDHPLSLGTCSLDKFLSTLFSTLKRNLPGSLSALSALLALISMGNDVVVYGRLD